MGMLIAAVVGLIVGLAMQEAAAAVSFAILGALLFKVSQLSQLADRQQTQIQALRAATTAQPKEHPAEPPVPASPWTPPPAPAQEKRPATSIDPDVRTDPTRAHTNNTPPPTTRPAVAAPRAATDSQAATRTPATLWASSAPGQWLAKTNMITRVGIVILFLGVSFLIKYAAESITVPIEMRLIGIAVAALVVFGIGWHLRNSKREYALLLQGTAVGTWYLVTYAGMKIYPVLPPSTGFLILLALSVFAALMSVKQDAKSLAVFGILGGFLAPILASTGDGNHVMLFGYYAILNAGILAIVWFKAWRALTLMGFVFTFIISVAWGITRYTHELFASTEPFLLLFMLFYVAVVMMFALRKRWPPHAFIDGPILFGTPAIGFTLQALLVEDFQYGMAWSALGFGVFYLGIVTIWWKMLGERALLLRESFLAIGIIMLTLAIPYAFDNDVTALAWAFEGAAAIWLSARQQRNWGGLLALIVQVGAGIFWLRDSPALGEQLFLNAGYASSCAIALVALWSAWLLRDQPSAYWVRLLHLPILAWALLWWFAGGIWQLEGHLAQNLLSSALLIFVSLSLVPLQWLRMRYHWHALAPVMLSLLPLALVLLLGYQNFGPHPFASFGYIAWPLTFITLYGLYGQRNFFSGDTAAAEKLWHAASYLMMVVVGTMEIFWQVQLHTRIDSWELIGMGLAPLAAVGVALTTRFWPAHLNDLYRETLVAILFASLLLNVLAGCFIDPEVYPLTYWPVLNPLDIWQITILVCAGLWWHSMRRKPYKGIPVSFGTGLLSGLTFIYLNTLLLRSIHVYADIRYDFEIMMRSDLVQTSFSIFWTLIGISLLIAANRRLNRRIWLAGMVLIAVVVAKLFLVDLSNSGTVERIVSFIVVGLLLLGVGYLAPLPDKEVSQR